MLDVGFNMVEDLIRKINEIESRVTSFRDYLVGHEERTQRYLKELKEVKSDIVRLRSELIKYNKKQVR